MKIQVTPGCGKMIPKPSIGHFRPKNQRYYNYGEKDGQPWGTDKVCEVSRDQYHLRMLIKTPWIHLVDDVAEAPVAPAPKPKKKDNK